MADDPIPTRPLVGQTLQCPICLNLLRSPRFTARVEYLREVPLTCGGCGWTGHGHFFVSQEPPT